MSDFQQQTVLITGAAGGIGQALAGYFAERGASLALLDRHGEALAGCCRQLTDQGARTLALCADIRDPQALATLVARAEAELGPIRVLVNNAGAITERGSLESLDGECWETEIAINLNGAFHMTRAVLPGMKQRRAGAIVTVGSVNGFTSLGHPGYSAAKAGLESYTRSLAMEYGPWNIRANLVCPGTVATPAWQARIQQQPGIFENLKKWYPLGRLVEPVDVARAVGFLASEEAGAITGATLVVDCGLLAGNPVMTREITLEGS